jgi:siderophore-iron reductase FhuF
MHGNANFSLLQCTFRIMVSPHDSTRFQIEATDLLDKEKGKAFLREVGADLQSPSLIVTASIFFKRFLALLSGALFSMTHHSYPLNVSLHNVRLVAEKDWKMPGFFLKTAEMPIVSGADRAAWREQVVRHIFRDTMKPLINALASYTRINPNILWAHAAYIVHYYYELWISEASTEEQRGRIEADFRYLVDVAEPAIFGLRDKNPLNTSFSIVPHPTDERHIIRIRKQCCLAYRLPGGKCCYTCPRLNEEERIEQILAYGS